MFLTRLALKNLIRHKNRTFITSLVIAAAVFFYIFLDSMIAGMVEMSYDLMVDYEIGHLQIVNQTYLDNQDKLPLTDLLSVAQLQTQDWESMVGYRGSCFELDFSARLTNGEYELPVVGKGIVPADFESVFSFADQYVEGSMFRGDEPQAVMGKRLAELLQFTIGDYITLLVRDKDEAFNTIDAEIVGLVHTLDPNVNNNIVYLPLGLVQQSLGLGDEASRLIIRLADRNQARRRSLELTPRLQELAADITALAWQDIEVISVAAVKSGANELVLALILIIAALAIINTVILAALERVQEIGMMKAMGLQVKQIIYIFMVESTGIGILGGVVGMALGAIGVAALIRFGLDFSSTADMVAFGIPLIGPIYGVWNPRAFLVVFFFGIVVSAVASIWPAYWAASQEPAQTIYQR